MEIIGRWNVAKVMGTNEDGDRLWLDKEGFKASPAYDPDDEDALKVFDSAYFFNEDGTVSALMAIPEGVSQEEIDEAAASGEVKIIDGMMLANDGEDGMLWKEEDGKLLVRLDGAWNEVGFEDGLMEFMFMKLQKA